jgi:hypothetical protein
MKALPPIAQPSFQTEQADFIFFFPVRSCEPVGLRREKSLFDFALAEPARSPASLFSALSVLNLFLPQFDRNQP